MTTITQATVGQLKQISRFGLDAIEKVLMEEIDLDNPNAQRVIERGDEFSADVREAVLASLNRLSVLSNFADEEVESSYGYFSGYKKPKWITEQGNILRRLFSGVGFADEEIAGGQLPSRAEGWFAIPKWQTMAKTYGEAVEKVFEIIKKTRNEKFYNLCEGQLVYNYLRQSEKSMEAFEKIEKEQMNYDILVIPAQFGLRHRGRSVRRALEVMSADEFGLGAFAVGIMLLTHTDRLNHYDDLGIDCTGDEFSPNANGCFSCKPYFEFSSGKVKFLTRWFDDAVDCFGSASGFLLQD